MMNATSQGLKQESDYYWEKERVMEGTTRTTKTTKTTRQEASFATSRDPFNGGGGGGGVKDWARLSNEEKIKLWTQDEEDMYRSHLKHTHQQNPSASSIHITRDLDLHDLQVQAMPPLHTDWSWHFQITFVGHHRHRLEEHIRFEYEPWQDKETDALMQAGVLVDGTATEDNNQVQLTLRGQRSPGKWQSKGCVLKDCSVEDCSVCERLLC